MSVQDTTTETGVFDVTGREVIVGDIVNVLHGDHIAKAGLDVAFREDLDAFVMNDDDEEMCYPLDGFPVQIIYRPAE